LSSFNLFKIFIKAKNLGYLVDSKNEYRTGSEVKADE
jgi:hypothetical protein